MRKLPRFEPFVRILNAGIQGGHGTFAGRECMFVRPGEQVDEVRCIESGQCGPASDRLPISREISRRLNHSDLESGEKTLKRPGTWTDLDTVLP